MSKVAGRRRGVQSWLVEPYRQVKLGLIFLVLNLLFSVIVLSVFGYYVYDMYTAMSASFNFVAEQQAVIQQKLAFPVIVFGLLLAVFVALSLMVSIHYTHQIYGPLVSIHRYLDGLLEGKPVEPLHLRESDQLQDLANKLNTVGELMSEGKRQSTMLPVYRFIDELLAGRKPQTLKFRDSDHLGLLSEKLNALAEKISR